jgi:cyclophilin family peptidyl-prolyl cis-trans isomerase
MMLLLVNILAFLLQTPAAPPGIQPAPGNPVVVIDTSAGPITVELFKDRAPVSVANFLQYANEGFYNGTIFHRVIKGYVIQGGGYTPEFVEKATRPAIQNEATNGLKNVRGTIVMARREQARSATAQFFINAADNPDFDHTGYTPETFGYAVFGRVIAGMDVVDKIAAGDTTTHDGMEDVPVQPVVIKSVTEKK